MTEGHAEARAEEPKAPAVRDDTVPGGPRWFHNLGDHPIWVETRTQLKRLMDAAGLVFAERPTHAKFDQSPWATPTRLKPGAVDPFVQRADGSFLSAPHPEPPRVERFDAAGRRIVAETLLTREEAALVRAYFRFVLRSGLEPELFCATCWTGERDDQAVYTFTDQTLRLLCRCRLLRFEGTVPIFDTDPLPPATPSADEGLVPIRIPEPAVALFHLYKRFLLKHHLREALRCNRCFDAGRLDGCEAQVTLSYVRIVCRCTVRTGGAVSLSMAI